MTSASIVFFHKCARTQFLSTELIANRVEFQCTYLGTLAGRFLFTVYSTPDSNEWSRTVGAHHLYTHVNNVT